MLKQARSLSDQIYDKIVDDIGRGRLAPGTHLIQERLAERFDVSRQPIQQAMARLKADGLVEEKGRRGLFVTALDPTRMLDHYGVRGALDGWAAGIAAQRISGNPDLRAQVGIEAGKLDEAADAATAKGDIAKLVKLDGQFHALIYATSGNTVIAVAAEPHWRFLRRAMGQVLGRADAPGDIWRQHREILTAMLAGDAEAARTHAEAHARSASMLVLEALLATRSAQDA